MNQQVMTDYLLAAIHGFKAAGIKASGDQSRIAVDTVGIAFASGSRNHLLDRCR